MNALCDHCGKETPAPLVASQITWCVDCVRDNEELLGQQELEAFSLRRIKDVIAANLHQSFGLTENVRKLKAIPKKLQEISQLPLGTRIKLRDGRLGDGQEGILVARGKGESATPTHILGWDTTTDHDTGIGSYYSLEKFDHITDHSCNRFVGVSHDRIAEVLSPKPKPPMKLKDAKLGDTVRIVGKSLIGYIGTTGTIIASDGGRKAIAITANSDTVDANLFVKIGTNFRDHAIEKLSDQEIKQFDKYLWFADETFQVEVLPKGTPLQTKTLLRDLPLGSEVEVGIGRFGTIIARDGDKVILGWKANDPRKFPGAVSLSTVIPPSATCVQGFKDYQTAFCYEGDNLAKLIPPGYMRDVQSTLANAPLGSEVEIEGYIGVVAGKNSSSTTVVWKSREASPYYSYASKEAIKGVGTEATKFQSLDGYAWGYNYTGGTPVVISPARRLSKSASIGDKIKWKGYTGTVIGRHQDKGLVIGWKKGETWPPSTTGKAGTDAFSFSHDKDQYLIWHKIDNNEIVELVESEDKMAVNVNTLQAGQEVDHPKHGRMIVLGTYSGSGERLLGKKEHFDGSQSSHTKGSNSASYVYWDKYDGTGYQVKWFGASEQVTVAGERILKFGLKVGDKVEIFKKKSYDGLMDSGYEPDLDAPKVVGTIVGFNANGEANVYLDDPGVSKDKLNGYNPILIDKSFLDNKSFVDKATKNPNNFWLIRTDKAFNKLKERKMEKTQERPAFLEMMKGDATNAAYRVASNQMTKGIKAGILAMVEKKGMDGTKVKAIAEMLDTEVGSAIVSMIIGLALTYTPKISEDPRAQKLAGEFRTESMAMVGNTVMDTLVEHFLPVLTGALNALPQETSTVRVADAKVEAKSDALTLEQAIREEEETQTEAKVAKA